MRQGVELQGCEAEGMLEVQRGGLLLGEEGKLL